MSERYQPDDIINRLMDHSPAWLKAVIRFLDATGMRVGELCGTEQRYTVKDGSERITNRPGLMLADVADKDLTGEWIIRQAVTIVGKGSKARTIPLLPKAKEAIRELIQIQGLTDPDHRLVGHRRMYVAQCIQKARKEAGMKDVKITPHSMRHRMVTALYGEGRIEEARQVCGHESIRGNAHYAHFEECTIADVQRAMEAVS